MIFIDFPSRNVLFKKSTFGFHVSFRCISYMCVISTRSGSYPTGYGMGFQGNGNGASIPSRAGSWHLAYINSYVSSRCLFQASIWPSEFPMNAMDKHVDLENDENCALRTRSDMLGATLTLNWSFEILEVYTRPARSSSFVIGKPSNLNGFSTFGIQQVDLICHLKTQTQKLWHVDKGMQKNHENLLAALLWFMTGVWDCGGFGGIWPWDISLVAD